MPAQNSMAMYTPMLIMMCLFCVISINAAFRKGKSVVLYGLLGLIPLINVFTTMFLLSMTDKAVMDKLNAIEELLKEKKPE